MAPCERAQAVYGPGVPRIFAIAYLEHLATPLSLRWHARKAAC